MQVTCRLPRYNNNRTPSNSQTPRASNFLALMDVENPEQNDSNSKNCRPCHCQSQHEANCNKMSENNPNDVAGLTTFSNDTPTPFVTEPFQQDDLINNLPCQKNLLIEGTYSSKRISIIIDTGAFQNIASAEYFPNYQSFKLGARCLETADNHKINVLGSAIIEIFLDTIIKFNEIKDLEVQIQNFSDSLENALTHYFFEYNDLFIVKNGLSILSPPFIRYNKLFVTIKSTKHTVLKLFADTALGKFINICHFHADEILFTNEKLKDSTIKYNINTCLTADNKQNLEYFLNKNKDLLASCSKEVGYTNLMQHVIDTGISERTICN
ncbi:unnamed protein product [Ceutorhynchus assimilis]|uniref:Uncharacterized protein n=1 Tax=Ceutorhynchus assimilis TaxID=467358 RepID=A0A9N9MVI9_9CUCU|nr:unnamed protein product [Ceutorhynchus assimilis]